MYVPFEVKFEFWVFSFLVSFGYFCCCYYKKVISAFSLIKVVYMGKVKLAVEAIYLLYKQKNKFCILSELSRQRVFFFFLQLIQLITTVLHIPLPVLNIFSFYQQDLLNTLKSLLSPQIWSLDFCTFRILSQKNSAVLAVELSSSAAYLGWHEVLARDGPQTA